MAMPPVSPFSLQNAKANAVADVQTAKALSIQGIDPSLALQTPVDDSAENFQQNLDASQQGAADTIASHETLGSALGNAALGIAQAPVDIVGSIAGFGAGLGSASAGTKIAQLTQSFDNAMNSYKSPELQMDMAKRQSEVDDAQKKVDAQYEKDSAASTGLVDSIGALGKKYASEAANTISSFARHPDSASDVVAQGIGSLVPFSARVRTVSFGAKGLMAALDKIGVNATKAVTAAKVDAEIDKATGSFSAARIASAVMEHAPTSIVGAAMEGGGAYQGAVNDVMNTKDSDLAANAPDYANILASVDGGTQRAKEIIANRAGLTAGAIAAPLGAGTSLIAGKFEANPLQAVKVSGAAKNIAKEATEEAVQGVTGQVGQNYGVQQNADPSKRLDEGAVDQAVQGAIGGIGAAVPTSSIGVASHTLQNLGATIKKAVSSIQTNKAAQDQANKDLSPTSEKNLNEAMDNAKQAAPDVTSQINDAIDSLPQDQASASDKQDMKDYVSKITDIATSNPADFVDPEDPAEIQKAFTTASNAVQAVRNLRAVHADESVSTQTRNVADYLANEVQGNIQQSVDAVPPEAMSKLPDHIQDFVKQYQSLSNIGLGATKVANAQAEPIQEKMVDDHFDQQHIDPNDPVESLKNSFNTIPSSVKDAADNDQVNAVLGGSKSISEAVQKLSSIMDSQNNDPVSKDAARNTLTSLVQPVVSKLTSMNSDQIAKVKSDPELMNTVNGLIDTVNKVTGSDYTLSGYNSAEASKTNMVQSAKQAQTNAALIESHPEKATPAILDQIAYHENNGDLNLTAGQKESLKAARAITDSLQETAKETVGSTDPRDLVSQQIAYADGSKGPSALTYARRIYSAYKAKDFDTAKSLMASLKNFSQTQNNKVTALNQHYDEGSNEGAKGKNYLAVNHLTQEFNPSSLRVWVNSKAPSSIASAQKFADEGKALANLYNHLAKAFPEIADGKQSKVDLASALVGNPDEIAAAHKAGTVKQEAKPEAKAEPEVKAEEKLKEVSEPVTETSTETPKETVSEPVAEETPEPEEPSKTIPAEERDLSKESPDLVKHSLFTQGFVPTEQTRLAASEAPMDALDDALDDVENLSNLVPQKRLIQKRITTDVANSYKTLLSLGRGMLQTMEDSLLNHLYRSFKLSGKDTTNKEQMLTNPDHLRKTMNKALNFVRVTQEEGKKPVYNYDPRLAQLAVMAALNWVAKTPTTNRVLDADRVAKSLQLPWDVAASPELVNAFNNGMDHQSMVTGIADMITKFWGVKFNSKMPSGLNEGLVQAMAIEVMQAMEKAGLITSSSMVYYNSQTGMVVSKAEAFTTNSKGKTVLKDGMKMFARRTLEPKLQEQDFKQYSSFLEEALTTNPTPTYHFSPDTVPEARSLSSNMLVNLNAAQRAIAKKASSIPHLPNMPMIQFYYAMGRNALLDAFGGQSDTSGKINIHDKESILGKNMSIAGAFDALHQMMNEADNIAQASGTTVDKQPHFFGMNFSSVNRMMYAGAYNPQSNKLLREALMTTWHSYDLTNDAHMTAWKLGLAQMLGVKIHNQTTEQALSNLDKIINDARPALDVMGKWVGKTKRTKFSSADNAILTNFISQNGIGFAGVNALMEYARSEQIKDKTNFVSPVYVEADGMSNGSANAMAGYANEGQNGLWRDNMQSVGVFFDKAMDNNTFRQSESSQDLYERTSSRFVEIHKENTAELSAEEQTQSKATYALLSAFNKDFGLNENDDLVSTTRNAIKNPQTQVVYSASSAGIAGTIASNLVGELYSLATKFAQMKAANPNAKLFEAVYENEPDARVAYAKFKSLYAATKLVTENSSLFERMARDPINFTVSDEELKAIKGNLDHYVAKDIHSAVTEMLTSSVQNTLDLLQTSMQIKSIVAQAAWKSAMTALIDHKKATSNWLLSDGFTREELTKVMKSIAPLLPMVRTKAGIISFGDLIRDNPFAHEIDTATSFTGSMGVQLTTTGVGRAGNTPKPNFVIGTGDAMAILNSMMSEHMPEGSTQIWDGVHFPAINAQEAGKFMNEQVLKSWQENNMAHVAKSFQAMMDHLSTNSIEFSPETLRDIVNAFNARSVRSNAQVDPSVVQNILTAINDRLKDNAEGGAERAEMFKNNFVSVNNMSSVEGTNYVANEKNNTNETEPTATPSLNQSSSEDMFKILGSKIPAESKGQRQVLKALQASNNLDGWIIYQGSQEELNKLSNQHTGTSIFTSPNQKGAVHLGSKTLYLATNDHETALHELIHAATMQAVYAVYARKAMGRNRQYAHKAVRQIEAIMNSVLNGETPSFMANASPELRVAYNNMVNQIEGIQSERHPIALKRTRILNEFMAWSLANKNLIYAYEKTPTNPIFSLAAKVINGVKKIVFGDKQMPPEGNTAFSNLLFSSSVLMNSQPTAASGLNNVASYMSVGYGSDHRLTDIQNYFARSLTDYLTNPVTQGVSVSAQKSAAKLLASEALVHIQSAGFNLTPQQVTTFSTITTILGTAAKVNSAFMARAQELLNESQKHLSMKDFMAGTDLTDVSDTTQAIQKYNAIFSKDNLRKDAYGRSSILPVFIAMSVVDDGLRSKLRQIKAPASEMSSEGTMDAAITNYAQKASDYLGHILSGESPNSTVSGAMDDMLHALVQNKENADGLFNRVSNVTGDAINKANQFLVDNLTVMGQKADVIGSKISEQAPNKAVEALGEWVSLLGKGLSSDGETMAKGVLAMSAKSNIHLVRNFLSEVVGRTQTNAVVLDMAKRFANAIQQTRQNYREQVPTIIAKKFTRPLTDAEWSHITAFCKTDAAALMNRRSMDQVQKLVVDSAHRASEIQSLETQLQTAYGQDYAYVSGKIDDLVSFMNTGKAAEGLLTNANAIADLLGNPRTNRRAVPADEALTKQVDDLITLRAIENMPINSKNAVIALFGSEKKGMSFLMHFMVGQRATEMENVSNSTAGKYNHYKGYFHKEQGQGHSLIVALDDTDGRELLNKSYTRVGTYVGSSKEVGAGSRGYYYAPVNGNTVYNQGIFQNVKASASGVSGTSGFTMGTKTAGVITDPATVRAITASRNQGSTNGEALRPVFDRNGKIFAYERMVDPTKLSMLDYDTHAARMIGAWRGRQIEEMGADQINLGMVTALGKMYQDDVKHNHNADDYINLFTDPDPIMKDAISLLSGDLKNHIQSVFGEGNFMVHKSLKEQVVGYHRASIGDVWTGNSRWSPNTQEMVRNVATHVMGNNAYQYLTRAERFWQDRVADAKVTIVVKSIVVAGKNLKDNIFQLVTRGVNPLNISKGIIRKTNELNHYIKGRQREIEVEADLRAATNPNTISNLKTELQAIRDGYRRLSIWPLLENGEFTGISGEGLRREDLELANGRWDKFLERLVDKLPPEIQTAGRYATIAKDTPLFQGLQKAVEYGDFLGKAIYYDHLMSKGLANEDALGKISEEYVNYTLSQGRISDYLDSMGLEWFWKTKVRLAKVALSIMRNNPLQALMMSLADQSQMFGSIDTPMSSNIFTQLADGRIFNSVGFGQLFRAPMMNPIMQILR